MWTNIIYIYIYICITSILRIIIYFSTECKTVYAFELQAKLHTYRFCDNVWTLIMENAEFKDSDQIEADKVKIVACDGRALK